MTKKRVPDCPNPATLEVGDTILCTPLMPGITSERPILVVTKVVNDKHGHSIDFDLTFFGEVIGKARGWVDGDALSWDEEITDEDPDYEIPLLDTGERIIADAETKSGMILTDEGDYMPGSIDQIIEKAQAKDEAMSILRESRALGFEPLQATTNQDGDQINAAGQTRKEFIKEGPKESIL